MEFFETYAKEIFSLLIPIITLIISTSLRDKVKLKQSLSKAFTFLIDEPMKDDEGTILQDKQNIWTQTHTIYNSGKKTATNIEIIFNWKPYCLNVWPLRHYEIINENDGRYTLTFNSLAPNEQIGIELLEINKQPPSLLNTRCDQSNAEIITMYPQPHISKAHRTIGAVLVLAGIASITYISIMILQFLITK